MKDMKSRMYGLTFGDGNPWDQFKIKLFMVRFKTLKELEHKKEMRFIQAIHETSDSTLPYEAIVNEFHQWYREIFLPRWWNLKPKKARIKHSHQQP